MQIIHVSAECFPVAKVGGLADVVGALPKYQNSDLNSASVIIPFYKTKFIEENEFATVYEGVVNLGNYNFPFSILNLIKNNLGFELFLVAIPELFDRDSLYGFADDIERFLSFQIAVLEWINSKEKLPDCINCHDHHTGLIPFMINYSYRYQKLSKIATVITIHNGLYQGQFGFEKLYYLPEFDLVHVGLLEWNQCINSLAVAIKCADAVTTVSPSYLNEINNYSNGLESLFNSVRGKSIGILNGIDTDVWNPETDNRIPNHFSVETVDKGKLANKKVLCDRFNLDSKKPLFCFIGRLFEEKGGDLLPQAIALSLSELNGKLNFLILGSGSTTIENQLNQLKQEYEGNYNVFIGYNEDLAHLIYAGADFLLMPSRVEPCGLNQMYAMRYGTIPIVRRTGGLRDSVIDFGDNGTGICHDQASVADIYYSIQRALSIYNDSDKNRTIRKLGMSTDHSWQRVCVEYKKVYNQIIKKNES